MTERSYRVLKAIALIMALSWVTWSLYDFMRTKSPADFAYHAASNYFADGDYSRALVEYQSALDVNPGYLPAKRGQAEAFIMLKREREAIAIYRELLARDANNAGFYANLGIAYDRLGEHHNALQSYLTALRLDPEIADGPSWMTRFLRNQYDKPPGIAERAKYLQAQLDLPEDQRELRRPEQDQIQQPYKQ